MVVVLLLLLSGDIEINPGPVGECIYFVSLPKFNTSDQVCITIDTDIYVYILLYYCYF